MLFSRNYRILVVDDLADNLILMQTVLEAEGYWVDVVDSGKSALERLQSVRCDLVLLDVMMPAMSGFEVTQRIRQHQDLRALPILLTTAHDSSVVVKGLDLGANDFVRKPIEFDELLTKVEQILRSRPQTQPADRQRECLTF